MGGAPLIPGGLVDFAFSSIVPGSINVALPGQKTPHTIETGDIFQKEWIVVANSSLSLPAWHFLTIKVEDTRYWCYFGGLKGWVLGAISHKWKPRTVDLYEPLNLLAATYKHQGSLCRLQKWSL